MADTTTTDGRRVYRLTHPITFGGQQITELAFRRPKAGDMRDFPLANQKAGDLLTIAGRICGQPPAVIDELDAADLFGIADVVMDFLPPGLLTGLTT